MTISKEPCKPHPGQVDEATATHRPEWMHWWLTRLPEKRWRLWSGIGLLVLIVFTISSVVTRRRSMEAYVTTDIVTITSPIQGVVTRQAVIAGQQFKKNETVIDVQARRKEIAMVQAIELRLREIEAEIKATEKELSEVQQVNRARLQEEVIAAQRTLLDLKAQHQRYRAQTERYRALVETGAMDADTLDGAQAMATSLGQRAANQQDLLKNLQRELHSAQLSGRSQRGVSSFARRMEAMEIEMGRLSSRSQELRDKRSELRQQLTELQKSALFSYRPQFPGQVLTSRFNVGDEVNAGSLLLTAINCEKLRVEALFEESKLRDLRIGQPVQIRWPASNRYATGRIESIRGEQGVSGLESGGGARFRPAHADRSRLLIALPTNALATSGCQLGEKVRVDL